MKLTREHVLWAYRLFLDREPESEQVIAEKLESFDSIRELRRELLGSTEFRAQGDAIGRSDVPSIVIKELNDRLRLFVDLADRHVGLNIISGTYEPEEQEFVRATVGEGEVAIDIGANIGLFSILMADRVGPEGHVVAFEPLSRNAALLEQSVAENGFQARVTVERAAVGDQAGELELITPLHTNNWGGAYLNTASAAVPANHEAKRVPVVKLDDYPLRRPVRFVKLDAEGAELLALRGAARLLREDRPIVLAELNAKQLAGVSKCSCTDVIREMGQLNYRCHPLVLGRLDAEIEDYTSDTIINVVFTPK